ncbi:MAG: hypothetical protein A3F31_05535 [Candidatus Levybacteria bacterium RIFCSPHIGHO2_12_FULL_38_12]|nr:MAG: hypothetical protein A3F31_05535 [Candidatus Levybacteria bacterium RIFCSPHIGHO2_12_FULL_38_12]
MVQANSLVAGKIICGKELRKNISPIDETVASQASFLSNQELIDVFKQAKIQNGSKAKKGYSELFKLAKFFRQNRLKFIDQIIKDTGFIEKDAEDLVDASIEFCENYHLHIKEISKNDAISSFSFKEGLNRKIILTSSPYGLIAITTPRNTPLITELTAIVHALWTGNILVLRPSSGVAGTISYLIEGLIKSFSSKTLKRLNIVFADAKDFVHVSLDFANLLHYVGSTKYLENTLVTGIKKGVKVLVDGDGCSLVLVDSTADIEKAANVCYQGLIRCNGQICISVRVIVVDQKVYEKFLSLFLEFVRKTDVRPSGLNKQSDMGPLFSSAQAENIIDITKKYRSLYTQKNPLKYGSNYISPVVVELKSTDQSFLKEDLFGPIVGISSFKGNSWKRWLTENPINLTDVVFSKSKKFIEKFLATSKSPRKVVNLDPTIESVFEPWGAFLPSGNNDVSYWYDKYRCYYQLMKE